MSEQMVITALGADRPGIVDQLSQLLLKQELNIEDSRMSSLGGSFAILLLVSGSRQAINTFSDNLAQIETETQMRLLVRSSEIESATTQLIPYLVEVVAMDNPGIVHTLASFFSSRQINIVDLETDCYPAPHTGTQMFSMQMTIGLPSGLSIKKLRNEFLDTCDQLNIDASITSA
jgi:glycine cleavage system transcriptional repressor